MKTSRLGRKATAAIFGGVLALFFFGWSLIVGGDSVAPSLAGAVVGGLVAGGLWLWLTSILTG